jgi:hypothetical protein
LTTFPRLAVLVLAEADRGRPKKNSLPASVPASRVLLPSEITVKEEGTEVKGDTNESKGDTDGSEVRGDTNGSQGHGRK